MNDIWWNKLPVIVMIVKEKKSRRSCYFFTEIVAWMNSIATFVFSLLHLLRTKIMREVNMR